MDQSGSNFKHYNELYFLFRPMVFVALCWIYDVNEGYIVFALSIAILCSYVWRRKRQLIDNLYNYKGLFLIFCRLYSKQFLGVAL